MRSAHGRRVTHLHPDERLPPLGGDELRVGHRGATRRVVAAPLIAFEQLELHHRRCRTSGKDIRSRAPRHRFYARWTKGLACPREKARRVAPGEWQETLIGQRAGIIRYSPHFDADGRTVLAHACRLGAERIVSKCRTAPYRAGSRSDDWRKTKCVRRQEFVVGGFTEPEGSREGVGSILVGYYE